jgi:hypothetical protein
LLCYYIIPQRGSRADLISGSLNKDQHNLELKEKVYIPPVTAATTTIQLCSS